MCAEGGVGGGDNERNCPGGGVLTRPYDKSGLEPCAIIAFDRYFIYRPISALWVNHVSMHLLGDNASFKQTTFLFK